MTHFSMEMPSKGHTDYYIRKKKPASTLFDKEANAGRLYVIKKKKNSKKGHERQGHIPAWRTAKHEWH